MFFKARQDQNKANGRQVTLISRGPILRQLRRGLGNKEAPS